MTVQDTINYFKDFIKFDKKCGMPMPTTEPFENAIKALEKQIPKNPYDVDEREGADFYYLAFMCPCCNEAIIGQPYRPKFCKHCGQKLDWG